MFSAAVASFLRQVEDIEILRGQLLTGQSTSASASLQFFPHGLGHDYKCVLVGAQNNRGVRLSVALPSDVRSAGRDPSNVFGVEPSSATAVTFSCWVF